MKRSPAFYMEVNMITIMSKPDVEGYKVSLEIQSNKEQELCEIYALIAFMINHDPEMINAVLDGLMHEITESTYNMDPERFEVFKSILEGIR